MIGDRANPSVVIIGAGMTGVLLAIKLREAGITRITLIEKGDSVGGTWRENTYPGVSCDVPAHAYTYSFEPNPEWSSFLAPGKEIHDYFERVFHKYGLADCTRFNEQVTDCAYSEDYGLGHWSVSTSAGATFEADLLFCATGMLHHPVTPDIEGRHSFAGPSFHTARWDHGVALEGKRIGVIGTGSTSSQLCPELIDMPGTQVYVFQRTPHWIIELPNRRYTEKERQHYREKPRAIQRVRKTASWVFSVGTIALTTSGPLSRLAHRLMAWNARRYLKNSVREPLLRKKLTPDYTFGCKRVVMNDTFYNAIQKPNAHLVTEGIQRIEPGGIVTVDGQLHELDIIIYATGFNPVAYMRPMAFTGRDGLTIEQAWQDKIQAYRNVSIPGFPNFFLMLGPNSPIGNNSVIAMSELQTDYCLQLIREWQQGRLLNIEARPDAMRKWNAMLHSKMKNTVFTSGCQSWYLDKDGDAFLWPDKWSRWVRWMKEPDMGDFEPAPAMPGETRS